MQQLSFGSTDETRYLPEQWNENQDPTAEALELVKLVLDFHKTFMDKKRHLGNFYNHFNVSWIAIYSDKVKKALNTHTSALMALFFFFFLDITWCGTNS